MSDSTVIRRLHICEKDSLKAFLNENWGSRHPLVNNEDLFNFYYADVDGENINFYALEKNGKICAVCGYINASEKPGGDIWISIWCAEKGSKGAGLELMGAMKELTGAGVMACNNIRPETMPFYTFLGYFPGKLTHSYRLRDRKNYDIAVINDKNIPDSLSVPGGFLIEAENIKVIRDILKIPKGLKPEKDYWYIEKRYFNYPYYTYLPCAIFRPGDDKACCLAVFRINKGKEGNVLRLVDFIGKPEDFYLLSGMVDPLLEKYKCEYCDVYSYGVDTVSAGFTVADENDKNIIPHYLNPLMKKNIDFYFFTTDKENFTMFGADGDQDRKNLG